MRSCDLTAYTLSAKLVICGRAEAAREDVDLRYAVSYRVAFGKPVRFCRQTSIAVTPVCARPLYEL